MHGPILFLCQQTGYKRSGRELQGSFHPVALPSLTLQTLDERETYTMRAIGIWLLFATVVSLAWLL